MQHIIQSTKRMAMAAILGLSGMSLWANVTVSFSSIPLRQAMNEIEKVSDLRFFYKADLPELDKRVTLSVKDASNESALQQLFANTKLTYSIKDKNVVAVYPTRNDDKYADNGMQGDDKSFNIQGVVTDENGDPLPGATIRLKNSNAVTVTDANGWYSLPSVTKGDKIEVSYIGYSPNVITVKNSGLHNVNLSDNNALLDEVVVVGYGSQKKINLTGAVAVVKAEDLNGRPSANAATALQGADPSVNLTFGSGGPNGGYSINIRGVASINGGSPLVLVDGVEMDLRRVNANDIESVSILKDASAAAIYGAKASSGVVLITSKSGKNDAAPRVTFDLKAGWKTTTASTDFMTSGFWAVWMNNWFQQEHAAMNMITYDEYDMAELWMRLEQNVESAERPWAVVQKDKTYKYYANYDWYNHYFRKDRPMQDYNVSITGGSKRVNYYVSGRMYTEDGMFKQNTDKYKTFSTRAKLNVQVTDWLKYGANVSAFSSDYNYPAGSDIQWTFKAIGLQSLPYIPSTNPDGTNVFRHPYWYSGAAEVGNGLNAVLNTGKHFNIERNREFVFKNDFEIKLAKDWTVNADYTYKFRSYEFDRRRVPVSYSEREGVIEWIDPAAANLVRDQYERRITHQTDNIYNVYTTYSPSIGQNNFKIMLGMNSETFQSKSLKATQLDLLSTELSSFNIATGEVSELNEDIYKWKTRGFFGRFNYDYAGKYLFEVSGRYDGSSRFAPKHRWGFFPSASLGWRMGQENFWDSMRSWWTDAKIRASVGSLGNQQVGYYAYIQTVDTSLVNSDITLDGSSKLDYATESDPVSGNLTWEKVITYDLGLDLSYLNGRLNFTGDVYIRDTKDMLTNGASLPAVYGASVPKANYADLRTKGYEISVSWNDSFVLWNSPFKYNIGAGLGDYLSKITKFNNPTKLLSDHYVGKTLGEIWGYKIGGLFPDDETAAAYTVDQSLVNNDILNAGPHRGLHGGDLKYLDLDGDEKISIGENTADKPGDRRVIGNSLPRYNYNFRLGAEWKGFDLSMFFQGVGHRDWYPTNEATTFWGPYSRPYQSFIEKSFLGKVWTYDNPNGYFPRWRSYEALGASNQLGQINDRYLQNIAYLRLKNLTVGYTLPVLKKYAQEIRVYFSGENLFYWSPLTKHCKSIDPETAGTVSTGNNYGFSKSFTFGLNVTF